MKNITEMKIYLLDINAEMCEAWRKRFFGFSNIEIVCDDFGEFMKTHKEVDCVVSPANAYGFMDGGYDGAITRYFGDGLQKSVQKYITKKLYYEQPVGTSIIVDTPIDGIKLIHTPTMQVPSRIVDYRIIYHCMRSTIITALHNNVKSIVIPAFGACTGGVPLDKVSELMWKAYCQIGTCPKVYDWNYAQRNSF